MLNKMSVITLIMSLMLFGCTSTLDNDDAPIVGCGDICEGGINR